MSLGMHALDVTFLLRNVCHILNIIIVVSTFILDMGSTIQFSVSFYFLGVFHKVGGKFPFQLFTRWYQSLFPKCVSFHILSVMLNFLKQFAGVVYKNDNIHACEYTVPPKVKTDTRTRVRVPCVSLVDKLVQCVSHPVIFVLLTPPHPCVVAAC